MTGNLTPEMLKTLSREALETEVLRLHQRLESAEKAPGLVKASQHLNDDQGGERDFLAKLRASQSALASSEARQRAIFDSSVDFAMVVTDPAGIITDWNPGATHVMGWTQDEMRGILQNGFSHRKIAQRVGLHTKW